MPADSVVIDNADIVGEDINEAEYTGVRGSLKWQITEDWDAMLRVAYQQIDAEGVFYQLPTGSEGQDLEAARRSRSSTRASPTTSSSTPR